MKSNLNGKIPVPSNLERRFSAIETASWASAFPLFKVRIDQIS